jgi:hypothetical protein
MKNPVLRKVDINELMDTMMELWTRGVDYVDIMIKPEDNTISLLFTEDYLSDEAKEELNNIEEREDEDIIDECVEVRSKLTDDDLNQLM